MMSIGIVGFGSLGEYLSNEIKISSDFRLAFVWNRNKEKLNGKVDCSIILDNLDQIPSVDLIIEVSHPCIIEKYAVDMLEKSNLLVLFIFHIGSPTVLADSDLRSTIERACIQYNRSVLVPSGAFWGAEDISKMDKLGNIKSLHVTMKKHPSCFKLESPLREMNDAVTTETILYNGSVSSLCPLAPNNVNTMAAACIAAQSLGFENVMATLVSDPSLSDHHIVQIELVSTGGLKVMTERINPSNLGVVTGSATYGSFLSSLKNAKNVLKMEFGIHLC